MLFSVFVLVWMLQGSSHKIISNFKWMSWVEIRIPAAAAAQQQ